MTPDATEILKDISTTTLTTVLLKKGLRNVWLRGTRPKRSYVSQSQRTTLPRRVRPFDFPARPQPFSA